MIGFFAKSYVVPLFATSSILFSWVTYRKFIERKIPMCWNDRQADSINTCSLYLRGLFLQIPLWMRGPNITKGQSVEVMIMRMIKNYHEDDHYVQVPVLTIDIAPTLLDLAGIPDNNLLWTEMDGLSICPLVVSRNGSNETAADLV